MISDIPVSTALLIVRLVLASVLLVHATQKSLGWFSGPGLRQSVAVFAGLGLQGKHLVILASVCELATALSFYAGFVTPLGAAIGASTLLVAGGSLSAKSKTLWNAAGGGEYPLVLALMCLVVAFAGPGKWSIDALYLQSWNVQFGWGAAAVAVLAALPPLFLSRVRQRRMSSRP